MRTPPKSLFWFAPLALLACSVVIHDVALREEAAPRPTVNHKAHFDKDLECGDCHDPEETGEPRIPVAETCFECHETLAEEPDRVQAYFDSIRQPDGSYVFPKLAYNPDLQFKHKTHIDYEMECADCHGEPTEQARTRPAPLQLKANCYECHDEKGDGGDCAKCHKETRRDAKPAFHDAAFRRTHGKRITPAQAADRLQASCSLCHAVPQGCNECHASAKPESHSHAGFRSNHGTGDTDVVDEPFAETSCAMCHEEQMCSRCHETTKPRNHTTAWTRRLHGIRADVERQSCRTCHQQDFCSRCHETTRPITHKGSFGSGAQAHCLGCHDPLPGNGCFVCHKNTIGHLSATPLPAGPPHATATDCRTCHTVLPHFDDGGNCRRCHR